MARWEGGVVRAFQVSAPGHAEIVELPDPSPGPGEVLVRTRHTAISRGTETLVFRGEVPPSQYAAMRAPLQTGEFPGPVVYGYLNVGELASGETVFCLAPHQTVAVVPSSSVVPVPPDVPPARAVLAGTVETAVNVLWDAAPRVGDRVAVIGAGMVGAAVAGVLARFPGVRVELVDVDPSRSSVAAALGVDFARPADATGECDLVVHASATSAGLTCALELLGDEGEVIEVSWFGDRPVTVPLGEAFHSRRLAVRASQVGRVAPARRARWTTTDRLALALRLLADDRFDALITDACAFEDLPAVLPALARGERPGLAVRVDYP